MGLTSSPGDSYHQRSLGNTEFSSSSDASCAPTAPLGHCVGLHASVDRALTTLRRHTHLGKVCPSPELLLSLIWTQLPSQAPHAKLPLPRDRPKLTSK